MSDGLSETTPVVRFGAFELDADAGELRQGGAKVQLSGKPFYMLTLLAQARGGVLSREELYQKMWSPDLAVDFDRDVTAAIDAVRTALGDDAQHPRFVETLPQGGYRFTGRTDGPRPARSGSIATVRIPRSELPDQLAAIQYQPAAPIHSSTSPDAPPGDAALAASEDLTSPIGAPLDARSPASDRTSPITAPIQLQTVRDALNGHGRSPDSTSPITSIVHTKPAQQVSSLTAILIVLLLGAVAFVAWFVTRR